MTRSALRSVLRVLRKVYRVLLLPAFALALLVIMWAAVVYQVGQEKISAHHEAVQNSRALARTLAEHTNHLLRQTDHATQLFKLKYEETEGKLRLPEFSRKGGLLDSLLPSKLELPLALLDARGQVIDSINGYFAPDQSDQPYFLNHAGSSSDTPLVATPVVEPRTKKWQIQLSRRLNDRHGAFAGVMLIMIDPAYFVEDYDRLNVSDQGAVMLISRDNGMLMGRVDEHLMISDSIDFSAPLATGLGAEELQIRRPFDNVERIYSFAELPRYGLMAVVGITSHEAMIAFEQRRRTYYGAVAVASLLVLVFMALLMQQSLRLRRSTRAVIEAQHQLRAATDASLDAVYLLKACRTRMPPHSIVDFTFVDMNERGAALLNSHRDELHGKRLFEVLPQLHTEGFMEKYLQVLHTGVPLEEEFETNLLPDARPHWLHHQIVPIDDGVAVTTRDITARKGDELAMRKNQAELAAVNDASPLGLIRADEHGHCTYVNRTFEIITGISRENALRDQWMQAIHPDDRAVLSAALRHMAASRQPIQDTLRCVQPDGTLIWISFKIAAMMVDDQVYGYVGTLDDITRIRKSVVALRESEARLRTIADTLPAMIAYIDKDEIYRFHNLAYEREFRRDGIAVLGRSVLETVGPARYDFLSAYIKRALLRRYVTTNHSKQNLAVSTTKNWQETPQEILQNKAH